MGRKCEYMFCSNREGENCGKSFYRFPHEFKRCSQWVSFCQSEPLMLEFTAGGPIAVVKRVLCSAHFRSDNLKNSFKPEKGLRQDAIPVYPARTITSSEDSDRELRADTEFEDVEYLDSLTSDERLDPESDCIEHLGLEYTDIEFLEEEILNDPPNDFGSTTVAWSIEPGEPGETRSIDFEIEPQEVQIEHSSDAIETATEESEPSTGFCVTEWSTDDTSPGTSHDFKTEFKTQQHVPSPSRRQSLDYKKLFFEEKKTSVQLRRELKQIKSGWRKSDQKNRRKNKWRLESMKRNKNKIKDLKIELKRVRKSKSDDASLGESVRKNHPVLYNSILNSTRKPKGRRYSPQMKKFSRGAYLAGPAAFRYMQRTKVLNLPNKMSIGRWNSSVGMKSGLNVSILNRLGEKSKHFSKDEKAVVISIDGMSIKQELSYNAKTDTFLGFPSTGSNRKIQKNDPMILATEAVVVMVSGIGTLQPTRWETHDESDGRSLAVSKRFKQAIGYELSHNTLGSDEQWDLVKRSVKALRLRGLYPLVLTMDQSTTNVKMAKDVGASAKNSVIKIDGTEVAIMFDTPHLLKSARNMLLKHNACFSNQLASFKWIKELFDIDHCSMPRLVPKLKEDCINLAPFASMNVSKAARTLSNSVTKGIQYYVETKQLVKNALGTATYVEFFDKLFDCFNSKGLQHDKKVYRGVIQSDSCHWEFLKEAEVLLSNMYFTKNSCFNIKKASKDSETLTSKQRHPNFVNGFIGNINALHWLWNKLHKEFGFTHLSTNHVNQDPNENLFSEIRRRCGRNDAPNAVQFAAAFRNAAIAANEKLQDGRNCEPDDAVPLCDNSDLDIEDLWEKSDCSPSFSYRVLPLKPDNLEDYTTKELNGLTYILGAAVSKIPHTKCRKQLTVAREELDNNAEIYRFCKLKNASWFPSTILFKLGMAAFKAYKQKFRKFLYQNRQNVKTRLKEYVCYDDFAESVCQRCFDVLLDKIYNTFFQGFLRDVKLSLRIKQKTMRQGKRNRKAIRMNLPG